MKKILSVILSLILLLGIFAGCAPKEEGPYAGLTLYENEAGISLYMDKGFKEQAAEGAACSYIKGYAGLVCYKESISDLEALGYAELSEADYASLIMEAYGYGSTPQTDEYGLTFATYEQEVMDIPFTYVAFYIKGENEFVAANFMCPTEDIAEYEADFHLWASSITLS